MRTLATIVTGLLVLAPPAPPEAAAQPMGGEVQAWFEAGRYAEAAGGAEAADPLAVYLAGLALVELDRIDDARGVFERLAARPEAEAWHHIGAAAALLADPNMLDAAVVAQAEAAARAAVARDDANAHAHYQLGLTVGRRQDYAAAAAAFDAAIARAPRFAYAYYYGGLSHYYVGRTDLMGVAFEAFLELAPQAPERARVETITRTLRGR